MESRPRSSTEHHWLFGYGSLIYKVDFPYLRCEVADIHGWSRRFWQGSHDHRGTPEAPGRVVTLVAEPYARCRGMAYEVDAEVFRHLDIREKNGYERHQVIAALSPSGIAVSATTYIASSNNPAFLGPADPDDMARHIATAQGPSGSNRDYLLQLASALRQLGDSDPHVFDLEQRVVGRQQPR